MGFTTETGRAYLEQRVKSGDKNAQGKLNNAAKRGGLGFSTETGRKYLKEHGIDDR